MVIAVADLLTQSHCTVSDSSYARPYCGIFIHSLSFFDHRETTERVSTRDIW